MRSVSTASIIFGFVVLAVFLAVGDQARVVDLPDRDDSTLTACDSDAVVVAEAATELPPRKPYAGVRFESPFQPGRLAVSEPFRPPSHLSAI